MSGTHQLSLIRMDARRWLAQAWRAWRTNPSGNAGATAFTLVRGQERAFDMDHRSFAGVVQPLRRFYDWCTQALYRHTVPVLALFLCLGLGLMLWHVTRLQRSLMESMALDHADVYTRALAEFRTLYTSEVVERVRPRGIEVTHDYENKEGAIPLPATLSLKLGHRIGQHKSGEEARLYSAYPFPWREELGGLRDTFSREAWRVLTQNPAEPFYGFEEVDGRLSLRYATADLMRDACVNCHNTHPDSPKTDWKAGDVRGVLEVIHPIDAFAVEAHGGMEQTIGLMALLGLLWLGGLGLVIGKLRRDFSERERRVSERTNELEEAKRDLEKHVTVRRRIETELSASHARLAGILDTAEDAVISVDESQRITIFNRGAEKIFGYGLADVMGRSLEVLMPSRFAETHQQHVRAFRDAPESSWRMGKRNEVRGRRKDGSEFPAEASISKITSEGHTTFTVMLRDITERKRAEEVLRQTQEDLEARVLERTARLATANRMLETEVAERRRMEERLQGAYSELEQRVQERTASLTMANQQLEAESAERLQVLAALKTSAQEFRALSESLPIGVFEIDGEGHCIYKNRAWENMFALLSVPTAMADWVQWFHPEERATLAKLWRASRDTYSMISADCRADTGNSATRWMRVQLSPLVSDSGVRYLGTIEDITERKQAEEQLNQAYARMRDLTVKLGAAEEEERKRIARELHDEFGQILAGLKFDLTWLGKQLIKTSGSQPALGAKVRSMSALVDSTIQSVQRITTSLRPSILDDLGLCAAVEWLGRNFQARSGCPCEVTISRNVSEMPLEANRGLALFRIAQELLTNVMRHAGATMVRLSLTNEGGILLLEVKDNGRGIAEADLVSSESLGIRGIRERAALLEGEVSIQGRRGQGTAVRVRVPAGQ